MPNVPNEVEVWANSIITGIMGVSAIHFVVDMAPLLPSLPARNETPCREVPAGDGAVLCPEPSNHYKGNSFTSVTPSPFSLSLSFPLSLSSLCRLSFSLPPTPIHSGFTTHSPPKKVYSPLPPVSSSPTLPSCSAVHISFHITAEPSKCV